MTKKAKRKRLPIVSGAAYKKGARFKVRTMPTGDVVFPGTVASVEELHKYHQVLLEIKADLKQQLLTAQRTTRRLEKRENLLVLAGQVDTAVDRLEDAVGKLHRLLRLLAAFVETPSTPDLPPTGEAFP